MSALGPFFPFSFSPFPLSPLLCLDLLSPKIGQGRRRRRQMPGRSSSLFILLSRCGEEAKTRDANKLVEQSIIRKKKTCDKRPCRSGKLGSNFSIFFSSPATLFSPLQTNSELRRVPYFIRAEMPLDLTANGTGLRKSVFALSSHRTNTFALYI